MPAGGTVLNHTGELQYAGRISAVDGLAAEMGLLPGDELLAVNDHSVRDQIDVQFYAAEPYLELVVRRDGELWLFEAEREPGLRLGLTFENPTFDTDVRRCNNRCLFCFVTQMVPPRYGRTALCAANGDTEAAIGADPSREKPFRPSLYVKDDDYRYSFLDGNYVTLTNLTEDDWERVAEQRLSPLYVSVHATDPALRRELLGNPRAPDVMAQLRRLAAAGIQVHAQLVILPGRNDGPHLERSVTDLAGLWPGVRSISVVPVGLTRFHAAGLRVNTPQEAAAVLDRVNEWQSQFRARWGERLVYATDEWYLLAGREVPPLSHYPRLDPCGPAPGCTALQENGVGLVSRFLDDWRRTRSRISRAQTGPSRREAAPAGPVCLLTGTLFAPVLRAAAIEFAALIGLSVEVRPVINTTLGETVTVAGLLLGGDVIRQMRESPPAGLLVLPKVMFRGPGAVTLDDLTLSEVGDALGGRVMAAETMSEVWQALARRGGSAGRRR